MSLGQLNAELSVLWGKETRFGELYTPKCHPPGDAEGRIDRLEQCGDLYGAFERERAPLSRGDFQQAVQVGDCGHRAGADLDPSGRAVFGADLNGY